MAVYCAKNEVFMCTVMARNEGGDRIKWFADLLLSKKLKGVLIWANFKSRLLQ